MSPAQAGVSDGRIMTQLILCRMIFSLLVTPDSIVDLSVVIIVQNYDAIDQAVTPTRADHARACVNFNDCECICCICVL